MNEQDKIDRIINKISELKNLDKGLEIFGAKTHKYEFNKPKTEVEIQKFENENGITLPNGYREFLKQIGNGGAGPYYGVEPLENGREVDLHRITGEDLINLSLPFPHTEHWNVEFEEVTEDNYEEIERLKEENYYDNKFINGLLRISNFGCGVIMNLVVNGKEKGNIWVDDRNSDNGIYPDPYFEVTERMEFLDWYEKWLDISLAEIKGE